MLLNKFGRGEIKGKEIEMVKAPSPSVLDLNSQTVSNILVYTHTRIQVHKHMLVVLENHRNRVLGTRIGVWGS